LVASDSHALPLITIIAQEMVPSSHW